MTIMAETYASEANSSATAVQTGPRPIVEVLAAPNRAAGSNRQGRLSALEMLELLAADENSANEHSANVRSAHKQSAPEQWGSRAHGPAAEPGLRDRGPAYAVMQECLDIQQSASPRGPLARVFGTSPLHPDARSRYRGALGEIVVAHVLAGLGSDWTVLHAVPGGSGNLDIDHVALGPAGIFTINTKNHSGKKIWIGGGTFLVNGHKREHMRNALHEAERASKRLSTVTGRPVVVTPLIVVVNPTSITIGRRSPRVTVLSSNTLKRWLMRRPRMLSDRAVRHFSMFAEERSTWYTGAAAVDGNALHLGRFEELRSQVDAARTRARGWLFALVGIVIVALPFAGLGAYRLVESALSVTG